MCNVTKICDVERLSSRIYSFQQRIIMNKHQVLSACVGSTMDPHILMLSEAAQVPPDPRIMLQSVDFQLPDPRL